MSSPEDRAARKAARSQLLVQASAAHHQHEPHPGRMVTEDQLTTALQVTGLCLYPYTLQGTARTLLYICDAIESLTPDRPPPI